MMQHTICNLSFLLSAVLFAFADPAIVRAEVVVPAIPKLWQPPQDGKGEPIDFALSQQADAWLRHVTLGDPSFDSFEHRPSNPFYRGKPPLRWPVNGFLFEDPKSGFWYAYVSNYNYGYDFGPDLPVMHNRVHRSKDRGKTWQEIGPIFDDPKFRFEGDAATANAAPDVSVVYADGRYHLAYDWATDNSRWNVAFDPPKGYDNGCAYAWSEKPEGPFHRAPRPILRTTEMPRRFNLGQKYHRAYGTTLVRRANDWLAMVLVDSGDYNSWGVVAVTAKDPVGPWSDPTLILAVDGDRFFVPEAESFPAMVHDGFIYATSSSVALNRDFQVIYRAPIEQAHRPDAWQLYQHGTAWHSDFVPNEDFGIWGQSYSGFVDRGGLLHVLFPSRERRPQLDVGTMNLADRPWAKPLRDRGFTLSGHQGPSLTLLRYTCRDFRLKTDFTLRGGAARIIWAHQAPLAPDRHAADGTIHPLSLTRHQGLELSGAEWRIVTIDAAGKASVSARGPLEAGSRRSVAIDVLADGRTHLVIDGHPRWDGPLPSAEGAIGLFVEPNTNLNVSRFELAGAMRPAVQSWLYVEALACAGERGKEWETVSSSSFRYGVGATRKTPGRAKWSFRGRGFRLWSPRGPDCGRCEVLLDGRKVADLELHAEHETASAVVYSCEDAGDGYHAVVLRSTSGRLVVDSLDALQ
jgi:hypothetical protein